MECKEFTIAENRPLTEKVHFLRLAGDTAAITRPGQFVSLSLPGFFLRRPFSVCDRDADSFSLLVERVGDGTALLHTLPAGTKVSVLTGLGNGFTVERSGDQPVLIGGGTGLSPLFWLARELTAQGKRPVVVLGFRTAADVFFEEEFCALGICPVLFTEDGSAGRKGLVTEALREYDCSMFYACGREGMLRAVCEATHAPGELAFDVRMGCGFGACMGCSRPTVSGMKRVCKDGPVFRKEELLWDA